MCIRVRVRVVYVVTHMNIRRKMFGFGYLLPLCGSGVADWIVRHGVKHPSG